MTLYEILKTQFKTNAAIGRRFPKKGRPRGSQELESGKRGAFRRMLPFSAIWIEHSIYTSSLARTGEVKGLYVPELRSDRDAI